MKRYIEIDKNFKDVIDLVTEAPEKYKDLPQEQRENRSVLLSALKGNWINKIMSLNHERIEANGEIPSSYDTSELLGVIPDKFNDDPYVFEHIVNLFIAYPNYGFQNKLKHDTYLEQVKDSIENSLEFKCVLLRKALAFELSPVDGDVPSYNPSRYWRFIDFSRETKDKELLESLSNYARRPFWQVDRYDEAFHNKIEERDLAKSILSGDIGLPDVLFDPEDNSKYDKLIKEAFNRKTDKDINVLIKDVQNPFLHYLQNEDVPKLIQESKAYLIKNMHLLEDFSYRGKFFPALSVELRADEELANEAIWQYGPSIMYASPEIRESEKMSKNAILPDERILDLYLQHGDKELCATVFNEMVEKRLAVFIFLDEKIQKSKEFLDDVKASLSIMSKKYFAGDLKANKFITLLPVLAEENKDLEKVKKSLKP